MGPERENPIVPGRKDSSYFTEKAFRVESNARKDGISSSRLEEIIELLNSVPETKGKEALREVAGKSDLSVKELSYFYFYAHVREEISETLEKGVLSPAEAEEWNEKFGFSVKGEE